jgi:hypothetical protein
MKVHRNRTARTLFMTEIAGPSGFLHDLEE